MATTLADLLKPALRKAGISYHPGTTPGVDEYAEMIGETNRMLAGMSIAQPNIYSNDFNTFPLTGAITYTIGPGGNFNIARPAKIVTAVIKLNGGPVRLTNPPIYITTDSAEWAMISLQAVPGCIPLFLYNDQDAPLSNLYLWPQDTGGDTLELNTWTALPAFTAVTDNVVLPPGYEDAIVNNLAVRAAGLYPKESALLPGVERLAELSLAAIQSRNAQLPKQTTDFPVRRSGAGYFDWRTGFNN